MMRLLSSVSEGGIPKALEGFTHTSTWDSGDSVTVMVYGGIGGGLQNVASQKKELGREERTIRLPRQSVEVSGDPEELRQ